MDPLTQGVLGATLPQATSSRTHTKIAGLFGLLAGMSPDLDVLIRSSTDPLLFLEYHRQFTHSLFFIPIGGLLCALVLHWIIGRRLQVSFKQNLLFCTLGYATHALLDACTTYGTQLLWPFSDQRFAWNNMSIIDPLYTLPLLALVLTAAFKKNNRYAQLALIWALAYPALGVLQRDRAIQAGWELAEQRGHNPQRVEAKPSFANLLVWKIVYEADGHYYVDAVRAGSQMKHYPGSKIQKLDLDRDLPWLEPNSQQAKDIERFRWFSNGYIAQDPANIHRVIDIRYSMIPNDINALWGIELSPQAKFKQHARYQARETMPAKGMELFKGMLFDY